MSEIIIKPIISEQSMKEADKGKYTFSVAVSANKKTIKQAVESLFNVHVRSVETITVKPGPKRVGARRAEVSVSAWKKAMVGVKAGEKIDLFSAGA